MTVCVSQIPKSWVALVTEGPSWYIKVWLSYGHWRTIPWGHEVHLYIDSCITYVQAFHWSTSPHRPSLSCESWCLGRWTCRFSTDPKRKEYQVWFRNYLLYSAVITKYTNKQSRWLINNFDHIAWMFWTFSVYFLLLHCNFEQIKCRTLLLRISLLMFCIKCTFCKFQLKQKGVTRRWQWRQWLCN